MAAPMPGHHGLHEEQSCMSDGRAPPKFSYKVWLEYYPGMKCAQIFLGSKRTRNPKKEADHVSRVTRRPPIVG